MLKDATASQIDLTSITKSFIEDIAPGMLNLKSGSTYQQREKAKDDLKSKLGTALVTFCYRIRGKELTSENIDRVWKQVTTQFPMLKGSAGGKLKNVFVQFSKMGVTQGTVQDANAPFTLGLVDVHRAFSETFFPEQNSRKVRATNDILQKGGLSTTSKKKLYGEDQKGGKGTVVASKGTIFTTTDELSSGENLNNRSHENYNIATVKQNQIDAAAQKFLDDEKKRLTAEFSKNKKNTQKKVEELVEKEMAKIKLQVNKSIAEDSVLIDEENAEVLNSTVLEEAEVRAEHIELLLEQWIKEQGLDKSDFKEEDLQKKRKEILIDEIKKKKSLDLGKGSKDRVFANTIKEFTDNNGVKKFAVRYKKHYDIKKEVSKIGISTGTTRASTALINQKFLNYILKEAGYDTKDTKYLMLTKKQDSLDAKYVYETIVGYSGHILMNVLQGKLEDKVAALNQAAGGAEIFTIKDGKIVADKESADKLLGNFEEYLYNLGEIERKSGNDKENPFEYREVIRKDGSKFKALNIKDNAPLTLVHEINQLAVAHYSDTKHNGGNVKYGFNEHSAHKRLIGLAVGKTKQSLSTINEYSDVMYNTQDRQKAVQKLKDLRVDFQKASNNTMRRIDSQEVQEEIKKGVVISAQDPEIQEVLDNSGDMIDGSYSEEEFKETIYGVIQEKQQQKLYDLFEELKKKYNGDEAKANAELKRLGIETYEDIPVYMNLGTEFVDDEGHASSHLRLRKINYSDMKDENGRYTILNQDKDLGGVLKKANEITEAKRTTGLNDAQQKQARRALGENVVSYINAGDLALNKKGGKYFDEAVIAQTAGSFQPTTIAASQYAIKENNLENTIQMNVDDVRDLLKQKDNEDSDTYLKRLQLQYRDIYDTDEDFQFDNEAEEKVIGKLKEKYKNKHNGQEMDSETELKERAKLRAQQVTDRIIKAATFGTEEYKKTGGRGLITLLHRYPSSNGKDIHYTKIIIDPNKQERGSISGDEGLMRLMNADYDGDHGILTLLLSDGTIIQDTVRDKNGNWDPKRSKDLLKDARTLFGVSTEMTNKMSEKIKKENAMSDINQYIKNTRKQKDKDGKLQIDKDIEEIMQELDEKGIDSNVDYIKDKEQKLIELFSRKKALKQHEESLRLKHPNKQEALESKYNKGATGLFSTMYQTFANNFFHMGLDESGLIGSEGLNDDEREKLLKQAEDAGVIRAFYEKFTQEGISAKKRKINELASKGILSTDLGEDESIEEYYDNLTDEEKKILNEDDEWLKINKAAEFMYSAEARNMVKTSGGIEAYVQKLMDFGVIKPESNGGMFTERINENIAGSKDKYIQEDVVLALQRMRERISSNKEGFSVNGQIITDLSDIMSFAGMQSSIPGIGSAKGWSNVNLAANEYQNIAEASAVAGTNINEEAKAEQNKIGIAAREVTALKEVVGAYGSLSEAAKSSTDGVTTLNDALTNLAEGRYQGFNSVTKAIAGMNPYGKMGKDYTLFDNALKEVETENNRRSMLRDFEFIPKNYKEYQKLNPDTKLTEEDWKNYFVKGEKPISNQKNDEISKINDMMVQKREFSELSEKYLSATDEGKNKLLEDNYEKYGFSSIKEFKKFVEKKDKKISLIEKYKNDSELMADINSWGGTGVGDYIHGIIQQKDNSLNPEELEKVKEREKKFEEDLKNIYGEEEANKKIKEYKKAAEASENVRNTFYQSHSRDGNYEMLSGEQSIAFVDPVTGKIIVGRIDQLAKYKGYGQEYIEDTKQWEKVDKNIVNITDYKNYASVTDDAVYQGMYQTALYREAINQIRGLTDKNGLNYSYEDYKKSEFAKQIENDLGVVFDEETYKAVIAKDEKDQDFGIDQLVVANDKTKKISTAYSLTQASIDRNSAYWKQAVALAEKQRKAEMGKGEFTEDDRKQWNYLMAQLVQKQVGPGGTESYVENKKKEKKLTEEQKKKEEEKNEKLKEQLALYKEILKVQLEINKLNKRGVPEDNAQLVTQKKLRDFYLDKSIYTVDENGNLVQDEKKRKKLLGGKKQTAKFDEERKELDLEYDVKSAESAKEVDQNYAAKFNERLGLQKQLMKTSRQYSLTSPLDSRMREQLEDNANQVALEIEKVEEELKELEAGASEAVKSKMMEKAGKEIQTLKNSLSLQKGASRNIWESMATSFKNIILRFTQMDIGYRVIGKIRTGIQKVVQISKELDKSMTNIQIVTGKTTEQTNKLMREYSKLAGEISSTTQEVAASANEWLRQGYDVNEVNKLITASMHLSTLGMMSSSEATKSLTSAMKGFKLEASDAMSIVDKFTAIDKNAAISAGQIAEGLSQFANLASMNGVDIDQASALVSTIVDVSQMGASSAGAALKTIISRFGNVKPGAYSDMEDGEEVTGLNDIDKVLGKIGISIKESSSEMRSFSDVLGDVAKKWNTLDDITKNAVGTAFAGVRQREAFSILMENYDKYEKLLDVSKNSEGTAAKKYLSYTEHLEAAQKRLTAAWEELAQNADIKKFLTWVTEGATKLVEYLPIILKYTTRIISTLTAKNLPNMLKGFGNVFGIPGLKKKNSSNIYRLTKEGEEKLTGASKYISAEKYNKEFKNTENEKVYKQLGNINSKAITGTENWLSKIWSNTDKIVASLRGNKKDNVSQKEEDNKNVEINEKTADKNLTAASMLTVGMGTFTNIMSTSTSGLNVDKYKRLRSEGKSVIEAEQEATQEGSKDAQVASKVTTGVLSGVLGAIGAYFGGPAGAALGVQLGGGIADALNKYVIMPVIDQQYNLAREITEIAEKELSVLSEISSNVTSLKKLSNKNWDNEDFDEAKEYINELLTTLYNSENSDLRSKLQKLIGTDSISDYLTNNYLYGSVKDKREAIFNIEKAISQQNAESINNKYATQRQEYNDSLSSYKSKGAATRALAALGNYEIFGLNERKIDLSGENINTTLENLEKLITSGDYNNKILNEFKDMKSYLEEIVHNQQSMIDEINDATITSAVYDAQVNEKNIGDMSDAELKKLGKENIIRAVANALVSESGASKLQGIKIYLSDGKTLSNEAYESIINNLKTNTLYKDYMTGSNYKISEIQKMSVYNKDGSISEDRKEYLLNLANATSYSIDEIEEHYSDLIDKYGDVTIGDLLDTPDNILNKLGKAASYINEMASSGLSTSSLSSLIKQYPELISKLGDSDSLATSLIEIYANNRNLYAKRLEDELKSSEEFYTNDILPAIENALSEDQLEIFQNKDIGGSYAEDIDELSEWLAKSGNEALKEKIAGIVDSKIKQSIYVDLDEISETIKSYQTKILDKQIDNLENQKKALQEINEQREYENKLIEAKNKLEEAQEQKKRVWREGIGWVYETDQSAVKEAQEELDALSNEKRISELEEQITQLTSEKEMIENIASEEELKNLESVYNAWIKSNGATIKSTQSLLDSIKTYTNAINTIEIGGTQDIINQVQAKKELAKKEVQESYDALLLTQSYLDENKSQVNYIAYNEALSNYQTTFSKYKSYFDNSDFASDDQTNFLSNQGYEAGTQWKETASTDVYAIKGNSNNLNKSNKVQDTSYLLSKASDTKEVADISEINGFKNLTKSKYTIWDTEGDIIDGSERLFRNADDLSDIITALNENAYEDGTIIRADDGDFYVFENSKLYPLFVNSSTQENGEVMKTESRVISDYMASTEGYKKDTIYGTVPEYVSDSFNNIIEEKANRAYDNALGLGYNDTQATNIQSAVKLIAELNKSRSSQIVISDDFLEQLLTLDTKINPQDTDKFVVMFQNYLTSTNALDYSESDELKNDNYNKIITGIVTEEEKNQRAEDLEAIKAKINDIQKSMNSDISTAEGMSTAIGTNKAENLYKGMQEEQEKFNEYIEQMNEWSYMQAEEKYNIIKAVKERFSEQYNELERIQESINGITNLDYYQKAEQAAKDAATYAETITKQNSGWFKNWIANIRENKAERKKNKVQTYLDKAQKAALNDHNLMSNIWTKLASWASGSAVNVADKSKGVAEDASENQESINEKLISLEEAAGFYTHQTEGINNKASNYSETITKENTNWLTNWFANIKENAVNRKTSKINKYIEKAKEAIANGNTTKAEKYTEKAKKLYLSAQQPLSWLQGIVSKIKKNQSAEEEAQVDEISMSTYDSLTEEDNNDSRRASQKKNAKKNARTNSTTTSNTETVENTKSNIFKNISSFIGNIFGKVKEKFNKVEDKSNEIKDRLDQAANEMFVDIIENGIKPATVLDPLKEALGLSGDSGIASLLGLTKDDTELIGGFLKSGLFKADIDTIKLFDNLTITDNRNIDKSESISINSITMNVAADEGFDVDKFVQEVKSTVELTKNQK